MRWKTQFILKWLMLTGVWGVGLGMLLSFLVPFLVRFLRLIISYPNIYFSVIVFLLFVGFLLFFKAKLPFPLSFFHIFEPLFPIFEKISSSSSKISLSTFSQVNPSGLRFLKAGFLRCPSSSLFSSVTFLLCIMRLSA